MIKNLTTIALFFGFSLVAQAADFSNAQSALDTILDLLTGKLAVTVATISVVILGFLALSGRLDMRRAINIGIGIVIIFGAPQIVALLT